MNKNVKTIKKKKNLFGNKTQCIFFDPQPPTEYIYM